MVGFRMLPFHKKIVLYAGELNYGGFQSQYLAFKQLKLPNHQLKYNPLVLKSL
jgi:hypothetical protein